MHERRLRSLSASERGDAEATALADDLLAAMASLRRSGRLLAGRPLELSALTGSQVDLIRLVRRQPNISVARAADELGLAANTVSTLVRQLGQAGLLTRTRDPRDRRVARLDLSPATRRRVDAFRDRRVALLADAVTALSAADRAILEDAVGALSRLAAVLPAREAQAV